MHFYEDENNIFWNLSIRWYYDIKERLGPFILQS